MGLLLPCIFLMFVEMTQFTKNVVYSYLFLCSHNFKVKVEVIYSLSDHVFSYPRPECGR